MTAVLTILALAAASGLSPTLARSRHHGGLGGHHHGIGAGGLGAGGLGGGGIRGGLASDQPHANDAYVNAAAQEEDKLLDSKIKSICRGC